MTLTRREFSSGLLAAATMSARTPRLGAIGTLASSGKSLLQLQQEFLDLRFGMYIHLNMATFEQREWGDPKASAKLFNPANLDTDQWAQGRALREYGLWLPYDQTPRWLLSLADGNQKPQR